MKKSQYKRLIKLTEEANLIKETSSVPGVCGPLLARRSNLLKLYLLNIYDFSDYSNCIRKILFEEELKRAERIRPERQDDFILRKGITRLLLGHFLKVNPNNLRYCYDNYGKPFLPRTSQDYFFSISHSKEYLLIAVSKGCSVGVDIEKIDPGLDYDNLLDSVFSEEELFCFGNHDRSQQLDSFYKVWVQKEAISKALGIGLSIGFENFTVNLQPVMGIAKYHILHNGKARIFDVAVSNDHDYYMAIALMVNE